MSDFRIFVGQYGNTTHGAWVDAADAEAVEQAVKLYSSDGAHEVGALDSEGFGDTRTEHIETLTALAAHLDGDSDAEAKLALANHLNLDDPSDIDRAFDDAYCGTWESEEEFTEFTFRECNSIPAHLDFYVDWESMAHDWFISDFYSILSINCDVYVFRNI
jgi:antirestriction protein